MRLDSVSIIAICILGIAAVSGIEYILIIHKKGILYNLIASWYSYRLGWHIADKYLRKYNKNGKNK